MKVGLIIDIAILVILVICGWNGFKNGIIRGICGIIAVILALYGASVVFKMYSNEFTSMLKPFVGGMIDRSMAKVLGTYAGEEGEGDTSDPSAIIVQNEKNVYEVSFATLRDLGLSTNAADELAVDVAEGVSAVGRNMNQYLTKLLCQRVSYVCVFLLAFIILGAILGIIGNTLDIVFSLPGLGIVDSVGGAIFGVVKGLLIIFAIAMFLRYTGLLLKENVIGQSIVVSKLLNNNPLANLIGI